MRYVEEFRNGKLARSLANEIRRRTTRPWTIMEICGGQTHSIVRYGIEELLPEEITLLHGPGCPVCVTPVEMIDRAIAIAQRENVTLTSFGDMVRVPGSGTDLLAAKAAGADVRIVYSPLDAVRLARSNPDRQVVFFAVGFETTAPPNAMAVRMAAGLGLKNFSILCSHVLVPPALRMILASDDCNVDAILAAGHVCTVMGYDEYFDISADFSVPVVVTGFEPIDILQGISMAVCQLAEGRSGVENQYRRAVRQTGNLPARELIAGIFEVTDRNWRGIGPIPRSGLRLREEYARFDAERVYDVGHLVAAESPLCAAGEVLQGRKRPPECQAFGKECTPMHPLGAPMVSSEGACAAYFQYSRMTLPAYEENTNE